MPLSPGSRLGHYDVTVLLGEGGMGQVWQATDTQLGREVALKILPDAFAADPDRLARFKREAQILASLNHPNIAAIYGIEESDDTRALVLELVEGPTLADRISKGPIPLDEALPIAKQIAEALEAAHEAGVIHRDLKPANIKVREDGTVKVLDFGLAKALAGDTPDVDLSQSPTMTASMDGTRDGVILGTAAYMSPEQARGEILDRRTDIWSFGCVLYEMLTGRTAFGGDTLSDTIANVIEREPEWAALPATLPAVLGYFLRRCVRKNLKQRVHHIADVRLVLEGGFETGGSHAAAAVVVTQRWWRRAVPLTAALGLGILVTAFSGWSLRSSPEPGAVARFTYDLPADHVFGPLGRTLVALSPDGRSFVYHTRDGLYLRTMGALEARLIPGTDESLANPFFSPDGQSVAYWTAASDQIKRIAISGGSPVVIADASNPYGASWGTDDTILYGQPEGILRVSATGGTTDVVIRSKEGERLNSPYLLPDGDSVLFSVRNVALPSRVSAASKLVVQSLSSGERTVLVEGGSDAWYLPTGHLVYALGDVLFAVALDLDSLTVSGGAVPVAQGVARASVGGGTAQYAVSDEGTLVYVRPGPAQLERTLVWVNREGLEEAIRVPPDVYIYPRISPDGRRVALDARGDTNAMWIWDFAQETHTLLNVGSGSAAYPLWTSDGDRLAYGSSENFYWKASNNTGSPEPLAEDPRSEGAASSNPYFFAPDETAVVFRDQNTPGTGDDLVMISLEDGARLWRLDSDFNERSAELSPSGRWMAYESDESGEYQVYVRPFPQIEDGLVPISNRGGIRPLWSRDGRELFYIQPGSPPQLISVPIDTRDADGTLAVGGRQAIMDWPYFLGGQARTYDVSQDGQQFLAIKVITGEGDIARPGFNVVLNWFEELTRLVPTN